MSVNANVICVNNVYLEVETLHMSGAKAVKKEE